MTSTSASIKIINEKLEQMARNQKEQRQKVFRKYSQQFMTLFQEWDADMLKAKTEGEKLANLLLEQRKFHQENRLIQSKRLNKIIMLYDEFLKGMEDMEEDYGHFLTSEEGELQKEMAKFQETLVAGAVIGPIPIKTRLHKKIYSRAL
ncbi:Synaptonemal complex protein 3 [Pteropus alecto]|uniref:Synaptonemal complex protein 3 n=1 Tax=Pteropus alecto TaxID=9402 RepID=L5L2R0_PTEAL|nr:Synaptonemal complex protein 3 [Pteropus alecto]